jgi:hypothetical protein
MGCYVRLLRAFVTCVCYVRFRRSKFLNIWLYIHVVSETQSHLYVLTDGNTSFVRMQSSQ